MRYEYQELRGGEPAPAFFGDDSRGPISEVTVEEINAKAKEGWEVISVGWGPDPITGEITMRAVLIRRERKE